MKKPILTIAVVILLAATSLPVLAARQVHVPEHSFVCSASTVMRVDPSNISVGLYETFSIDVVIENVSGMAGYEVKLFWNTSILTCTQWNYTSNTWKRWPTPSTPPSEWGSDYFQVSNNITVLPYNESRYWVAVVSIGGVGISGNFTVASLEFNATGLGTTSLDLYDTELGDNQGRHIEYVEQDATVHSLVHDVAVESIVPKSSVVTQNSSVEIGVAVKNDGNCPENLAVSTYYNSTLSGVVNLIERQNLVSLLQNTRANLIFVWNTTGVAEGSYQVFANVSIAENETNTINNQFKDGIIEVSGTALHDIAITALNANATTVTQEETVAVTVAVKNQGWTDETNVNLAVYCDSNVLGEVQIPLIHPNSTKGYVFYWNTTGIRVNVYRLKASVTVVPGDADATNNYYEDGMVEVSPVIAEFTSVMLLAVFGIATVSVAAFAKKVPKKTVSRLG